MIILPETDEALLKECRVETMRSQGKGGQHINTSNTKVRLIHIPSQIIVTSQKERSQYLNKKECLSKLRKAVAKKNYRPIKRVKTKPTRSTLKKEREHREKEASRKRLRKPIKKGEAE